LKPVGLCGAFDRRRRFVQAQPAPSRDDRGRRELAARGRSVALRQIWVNRIALTPGNRGRARRARR